DSGGGLTGGAITGSGTLAVGAGTGIVVNADDVAVDVGTSANKIVQLNSSSQIPAVSGALLTAVRPGNVSNVLDTSAYALTDTDAVVTGSNASITPSSTASRILIAITVTVDADAGDDESDIFKIWRGSSCSGTQVGGSIAAFSTASTGFATASAIFVDSPLTTSSQAYVLCEDGDSTGTVSNTVIMANVTLMEIGP
ncbi:MAG: hypothetical protein Q7S00_03960, partial [bacterium]|nr:hypothetical protein [bacterium]